METGRTNYGIMQLSEYEVEIHYEKKLREVFHKNSSVEGTINSEEDWTNLLNAFRQHELMSIKNVNLLDKHQPSLPISFQVLLTTISQLFGDKQVKDLGHQLSESKEQLENCRTYINMLNINSLNREEIYQLANIVYHCKKKASATED